MITFPFLAVIFVLIQSEMALAYWWFYLAWVSIGQFPLN